MQGWDIIEETTLYLFKHSVRLGSIPECWKLSRGIPLPKPGKDDYTLPKSFRLVCIQPVLLKLMERLVLWHLKYDLNILEALNKSQHGFSSGSSTESAVHRIVHKIEEAISCGNYALGIFLDIEGAFDNISFEAIKQALMNSGMSVLISNWIYNSISCRSIIMTISNISVIHVVERGCPQGGILSPFLWNLVLNWLLRELAEWDNSVTAFADDLVSLTAGIDPYTLRDIGNLIVEAINDWCKTTGLSLSIIKTQCILFTRNRSYCKNMTLEVLGSSIPLVQDVKYLGVYLDKGLYWTKHCKEITAKATKIYFACSKAIGYNWGLKPFSIMWIYKAIIRPILSYCSVVWTPHIIGINYAEAYFIKIQRMACNAITGAMKTSSLQAIEIMCKFRPVMLYLKETAIKAAYRLKCANRWIKENIHSRGKFIPHTVTLNLWCRNIVILSMPNDRCTPVLNLDRRFSTSILDLSLIHI